MKKLYKFIICAFVCLSVIFTCSTVISAASLAKVKNVSVSSVAANKVTLKWKKVSGATGYRVYRYNAKKEKYVYIGKTTNRKYTDTSVSAGKAYRYKVRAYKTKKNKNTYGTYSAAVKAVTKPKKVTKLKADYVGTNMARLSWKAAKGASGYEIFIYDYDKKEYISKGTVSSNSCVLKKLTTNTKYKIKIAAFHKKNGKVYGLKSKALTFKTSIPAVASLSVTNVTNTSYTLTWGKVTDADGYQLLRYNVSKQSWDTVLSTQSNSYTVTNLASGVSHQYKVRAYIKSGSKLAYGGYSPSVTATTLAGVPGNLTVTTDNKTISLAWTANGSVTGYEISRYNAANGSWEAVGTSVTTSFVDDTVSQTSSYTYKVRGYTQATDGNYYTEYTPSVTVFFESTVESESIYSQQMAEEGVLGYLYDPAEGCFYTASDPWHREIGYNELFDTFAPLTLINFDTLRLKFDYDSKNWLIQVWKGQYGMVFYGAEIGVYYKPADRSLEHYDCVTDDDLLKMSFDFYKHGIGGWEKKFSRPYGSYWWCTGFIPGNVLGMFNTLRVDARITMKDYEMLSAFRNALDSEGVSYTTNGLNVYFSF